VVVTMGDRLNRFQAALHVRAATFLADRTRPADSLETLSAAVEDGFASILHCGRGGCEDAIQQATTATPRCVPFEAPPEEGPCAICAQPSAYGRRVLFARAY